MTMWFMMAYGAGLFYLLVHPHRIRNKGVFHHAWIWYGLVLFSNFVFMLFRSSCIGSTRSLATVQIWADGVAWLFLAISLLILPWAVVPHEPTPTEPARQDATGNDA